MQLQDEILRDGDGIETLVYNIQHVTIASDFLLVTIPRRGFIFHQLPYADIVSIFKGKANDDDADGRRSRDYCG